MPKASEIKRGQIVDIDAAPRFVKTVGRKAHQRGAATLYEIKSRISSRGKSERRPAKVTSNRDRLSATSGPIVLQR